MTPLHITLTTLPPSLNNLYATVNGRRVLTSAARAWKGATAWEIKAAALAQGWAIAPKTPLAVTVAYSAPDVLRWDLDGKAKLLLDALCEAFGIDDRYVMTLAQSKARGAVGVRMEVRACS